MVGTAQQLRSRLQLAQGDLARRTGERDALADAKNRTGAQLAEARNLGQIAEQVVLLLRQASDYAREQARETVQRQVTQALSYVFDPDMAFRIVPLETRGKPEIDFFVASTMGDARIEIAPQDGRGGGVVDVVSLALRVALLETYRPTLNGPLVLDEPAKHVSEEYIQRVADFLREVARYYRRQVIMVTHNAHLAGTADLSYQVRLRDGRSGVERA